MHAPRLPRSLRGGAVVPFPKDSELAAHVISCGPAGGSEYRAAWVFAALSHFLSSQGVVTQHFCKRQLRLSCCTLDAGRELVEQFVAQLVVVRDEVLISLQRGAESTEFPLWNDRIRVFVSNQARLLPSVDGADDADGADDVAERCADLAASLQFAPGDAAILVGHSLLFRDFIRRYAGEQLAANAPGLAAQLAGWVAEGKLKPHIDAHVPFEEAAVLAAFDKLKGRRTKGKLVVDLVV